MTEKPEINTG